jgi:hypothetical protein
MKIEIIKGEHKGTVGQVMGAFPLPQGLTYAVCIENSGVIGILSVRAADVIEIKKQEPTKDLTNPAQHSS